MDFGLRCNQKTLWEL